MLHPVRCSAYLTAIRLQGNSNGSTELLPFDWRWTWGKPRYTQPEDETVCSQICCVAASEMAKYIEALFINTWVALFSTAHRLDLDSIDAQVFEHLEDNWKSCPSISSHSRTTSTRVKLCYSRPGTVFPYCPQQLVSPCEIGCATILCSITRDQMSIW